MTPSPGSARGIGTLEELFEVQSGASWLPRQACGLCYDTDGYLQRPDGSRVHAVKNGLMSECGRMARFAPAPNPPGCSPSVQMPA